VPDFDTLYDQHFRFVWRLARRMGVETSAIDDVVQEVFVVIHSKLETVRSPDSMRSWIYGIVRRAVSEHRRAVRRSETDLALPKEHAAVPLRPPTPLELTELSRDRELLATLLSELTEAKREVFILAELEEMSVPEIAEALEIPLNTAYSRLRHARQEFETALARRISSEKKRGLACRS
jgi:RNA polymerase sigma-70 factor, ECF subfamily